jgi:hypothetical protein
VRAIEISQESIIENPDLVEVESTDEVITSAMNVPNFQGCLPTDLALDADINSSVLGTCRLGSIANTVPKFPASALFACILWSEPPAAGRKGRSVREPRIKPRGS